MDLVVGTVVDLHLDDVAVVVEEDDDGVEVILHHGGDVLRRHLEAPIADESEHPLVLEGRGRPKGGADRPADAAVLHLELVQAAFGELQLLAVEPTVAGFRDHAHVRSQEFLHVMHEDVHGEWASVAQRRGLAAGHEHAAVVHQRGVLPLALAGQHCQDLPHQHAVVPTLPADDHLIFVDCDHLLFLQQGRVPTRRVVVVDSTDKDVHVR
mmetsp:Transcript_684/g.1710  ORF Transcript_684/g.1710 Transcript_684/m.1710 type:complete len:210 (-) Transcript_684:22-651(-)